MRLHRLRLVNFRQYADCEIVVGPGITGIIGPNGSGKSTLLEAIAWAIYGNAAARGDKDGIRNLRAKPRTSVRVELEFGLGAHEYRVVRGLHGAELYQDGVDVANSLTEVTTGLERVLGMRHDEFFNTYFTGQKELAVMASLGKTDRAAFLSRVLGYDRLRLAQERVRERRNALASELRGLEAGLPESARLAAERMAAAARLDEVRRAAQAADAQRGAAERQFARVEPEWEGWVEREKRGRSLGGGRREGGEGVPGGAAGWRPRRGSTKCGAPRRRRTRSAGRRSGSSRAWSPSGRNGWSGRSGCAPWTATGGWPSRPSRWRGRSASGSTASSPTRSTRGSSSNTSGRSSSPWSGSSASWASWSGCSRRRRRGAPTRRSSRSCVARRPPWTVASTRSRPPPQRSPTRSARCWRWRSGSMRRGAPRRR